MFLQEKINLVNDRMAKSSYIILTLIAITLIIYLGIDTFYRVMRINYSLTDTQTYSSTIIKEKTRSVTSGINDYRGITERNIFSKIAVTAQKGAIDIDNLDSTSLKLALVGTFVGNDKTSAAVIEDSTTRPVTKGLYRIGDTIQNAEIKSIVRKKVVLRVGNKDEVLTMEEGETGSTGKAQTETAAEQDQTAQASSSVIERNVPIKRSLINDSLKDLNELLSQASIKPHSTDGEPDGLAITGIKAGSIYRRMGLRNGDIIKGVNNEPIRNTEDLIGMYEDLKSAPEVSLQITRRGQERSFNYTLTD